MSSEPARLTVRDAVALGLLHGPAELLPVSSSGHVTLVPWLARWEYAGVEPELRKAFEVALHAGTAAALLVALRDEVSAAVRDFDRRRATLVALSFLPPAAAGWALERPIEQRLGTPATIAVGLLAGAGAMAIADRWGPVGRSRDEAGWRDALALGLAQAAALMPGVSRNGATLAAARARGFDREAANALSRHVALPIILGASALKGTRLWRRGLPRELQMAFAAGMGASFASTLASTWLIRRIRAPAGEGGWGGRSLAPYAAYRAALAGLAIRRLWQDRSR